ncbi:MAG: response regulator transcription factor [Saprospiraceae bacterium]|nr:response regulator transcription factor [Saprospiraceae bacterium]
MLVLNAIIIEDEKQSQVALIKMLGSLTEYVSVVAVFESVAQAVPYLRSHEVDLVFLDIELPNESGFGLFNYNLNPNLKVIFTTAYNHYAIQAFKISAVDYLLKPLDRDELRDAVIKVRKIDANHRMNEAYKILIDNLNQGNTRIAISHQNGYDMVETSDILWLEAEINYTTIHLRSKRNVTVAKTLRIFEESLDPQKFFRISRSAIVNVEHITRLNRNQALTITLTDSSTISVSEARKDEFLNLYKKI